MAGLVPAIHVFLLQATSGNKTWMPGSRPGMTTSQASTASPSMQTLRVNGYDMPYLDVGHGPPLVCVHGSLCDFRNWGAVIGPLSQKHRVIAVSLRHFFPEHWDGVGDTYSIAQHVDDMIGFIEKLDAGAINLMGHSRGGHICFRLAGRRGDLLRKLILAEPGGELDATLDPDYKPGPSELLTRFTTAAEKIAAGDVDGGLSYFMDVLEGPGTWKRMPAMAKQLLRDNAYTLIGQVKDRRPPFSKADVEAIKTPTLFIGGARTKGMLPKVLHTLAANIAGARTEMIAGATHPMFEQAPQKYSEIVLNFLES
jgi:pimeloyl-ACP methyl ester carboxylesterase